MSVLHIMDIARQYSDLGCTQVQRYPYSWFSLAIILVFMERLDLLPPPSLPSPPPLAIIVLFVPHRHVYPMEMALVWTWSVPFVLMVAKGSPHVSLRSTHGQYSGAVADRITRLSVGCVDPRKPRRMWAVDCHCIYC